MAGIWHLSHSQLHDANGLPLAGARAYFFAADTLTPLIVYQDYSLALPHPSPVVADGLGFFPPVFFDEDDGFYRQRITNSAGVLVTGSDVIVLPIIGPAGGGGGSETPVDANSLFRTGDLMWLDVDGSRSGWVRDNGRTIGSATSGATERANADAEALFLFLWNNFNNTYCPVPAGRGASAAADWAANKQITTPDKRGFSPAGLTTMGNSATGGLNGVPAILGDQTTPGSKLGAALHTLTAAEMPVHNHAASSLSSDAGHVHSELYPTDNTVVAPGYPATSGFHTNAATTTTGVGYASITTTTAIGNAGSGVWHNNTSLIVLGSFFRKL